MWGDTAGGLGLPPRPKGEAFDLTAKGQIGITQGCACTCVCACLCLCLSVESVRGCDVPGELKQGRVEVERREVQAAALL